MLRPGAWRCLLVSWLCLGGVVGPAVGRAEGFRFPLGNGDGEGYAVTGHDFLTPVCFGRRVDGRCVGGCGSVYHPGEDWNADRSGRDWDGDGEDAGDPVGSIGDGEIEFAGWGGESPGDRSRGYVVLVRHAAPEGLSFQDPDGGDLSVIWAFYGHLGEVARNPRTGALWKAGEFVGVGEVLGSVGDYPHGSGRNYHLHFELRKRPLGPQFVPCRSHPDGLEAVRGRYLPPSRFLRHNR